VVWDGLPTDRIADASVGGGCGRFAPSGRVVRFDRTPDGGISFPATVNGVGLRLSLDARADGPPAISLPKAQGLSMSFSRDVYGRSLASGAALEIGGFTCRGIHVEAISTVPAGSDGTVGGTLFRETVVELDPGSGGLALHDPARWVSLPGFNRIIVDDDGDRPVATVRRKAADARVLVGSATGTADLRIAPAAAARLGVAGTGEASGLRWGILNLPTLRVEPETLGTSPDWGDDGRLGFAFLLRFHMYLDMPHRWIYLKPPEPARP
jgi:hypothetical protein